MEDDNLTIDEILGGTLFDDVLKKINGGYDSDSSSSYESPTESDDFLVDEDLDDVVIGSKWHSSKYKNAPLDNDEFVIEDDEFVINDEVKDESNDDNLVIDADDNLVIDADDNLVIDADDNLVIDADDNLMAKKKKKVEIDGNEDSIIDADGGCDNCSEEQDDFLIEEVGSKPEEDDFLIEETSIGGRKDNVQHLSRTVKIIQDFIKTT